MEMSRQRVDNLTKEKKNVIMHLFKIWHLILRLSFWIFIWLSSYSPNRQSGRFLTFIFTYCFFLSSDPLNMLTDRTDGCPKGLWDISGWIKLTRTHTEKLMNSSAWRHLKNTIRLHTQSYSQIFLIKFQSQLVWTPDSLVLEKMVLYRATKREMFSLLVVNVKLN